MNNSGQPIQSGWDIGRMKKGKGQTTNFHRQTEINMKRDAEKWLKKGSGEDIGPEVTERATFEWQSRQSKQTNEKGLIGN